VLSEAAKSRHLATTLARFNAVFPRTILWRPNCNGDCTQENIMQTQSVAAILVGLTTLLSCPKAGIAQTQGQVEAIRGALSGQRLFVTYRDGGSMYGTRYFLDVQFCRTGRYVSGAESRKTTVLGNEQVNRWTDIGRWDIISYQGQPVLKYVSSNGQTNFAPAALLPDGSIWLGQGVSVQRTGITVCQ
jgi:hypothetical protein